MANVDGTWKTVIITSMGKRNGTLTLTSREGHLTGDYAGDLGHSEVESGTISGDAISFRLQVSKPMRMTLKVDAVLSADALDGTVKSGTFGSFRIFGERSVDTDSTPSHSGPMASPPIQQHDSSINLTTSSAHGQPFRSPERDELLAAVKSVAGCLDGAAMEAEERRDLSAASVAAMREAGLLKYAAPRIVGGYEVDPITAAEVSEAIARVDLCAAWLAVQQATSISMFSRVVSDAAFETLFGNSRLPITCGSILPLAGAFRPVEGGYRVTGRWSFLSAVTHAQWVTVPGTLADAGEGATQTIGAVIPKSAVIQVDNWHVAGMKASGSYDISVEDLFVPVEMTYAHKLPPVRRRDVDGRRGLPPHMNAVAMGLGAARRVIDELIKQALAKRRPGAKDAVAQRPYFQHFLGESEMRLRAARAGFYALMTQMWSLEREDEPFPFELTAQLTASPAFVFSLACDIATQALRFIGSNAARLDNPLQRFHRDLTVMSLHVQNGEQYYETFGQQLLGLEMVVPGGSNMIGARARVETNE